MTVLLTALFLIAHGASAEAGKPARTLAGLSWLSGCWKQDFPGGAIEEYWTRPEGNTLLQMGRMIDKGETAFYETMRIQEKDGRLRLRVEINGKRSVEFDAVEHADRRVVFQTPRGVPTEKLVYEGTGSILKIILEKTRNGKKSRDEFALNRVDCREALADAGGK